MVHLSQPVLGDNQSISLLTRRRSWIVSLKTNCHEVCLFFLSSQICYENPDFNLETYAKKSGWKFIVLYLTFTKQAMNNNNYNKSVAFWWKGEKMKNTRVNPSPLRREFISIFRSYGRQSGNKCSLKNPCLIISPTSNSWLDIFSVYFY